ncbi:MAG: hypothetical protein HOZ81_02025 [Streptomyces sp.]|nr:hypothetical protein [Streptomyces sp.]NUT26902.1 hypothetical protein [Streptomyces sp.]
MSYRTPGRQGPQASSNRLNTWTLSGFWGSRTEPGGRAVRRGFGLGVDYFGSAHAYGVGGADAGLAPGHAERSV